MKNKIVELLVCMLFVGAISNITTEEVLADQEGHFIYTVNNGEATITEYVDGETLINLTIPSTLGGYPTVAIGDNVFQDFYSLTSVTIPNSVTTIGNNAFQACESLTSIIIPGSVITIGKNAFRSCSSLPFITIPESVATIGDYAFDSCTSLTAINISSANANYTSIDGVLYNKAITTLIQYPGGKTGAFTVPNSVTAIRGYAFDSCVNLTSLTIPNSVTTIGNSAFSNCISLTSVVIPNSVTTIGDYLFVFCSSLMSVSIPDGVTTIGKNAFQACSALTSVTIGTSVTTIGAYAFDGCFSLASITFLGLIAPTNVGSHWLPEEHSNIRGHAYAGSTFPAPGENFFNLTMGTVLSGGGGEENIPPRADFTWTPSNPKQNETIIFTASASNDPDGSITLYEWDWENDGSYDESHNTPNATHMWTKTGNYSVTVRVTDNRGATDTVTKIVNVSHEIIENLSPIANFTWSQGNLTVNQTISFDASPSNDPDGSIVLYEWDWNGDGVYDESRSLPTITHSWTQAGNHTVTLRVTDDDGSTNTKTMTVVITSENGTNTDGTKTPGFEIIIALGAITLVMLLKRKLK